jgi:hypothetical protein
MFGFKLIVGLTIIEVEGEGEMNFRGVGVALDEVWEGNN